MSFFIILVSSYKSFAPVRMLTHRGSAALERSKTMIAQAGMEIVLT
jgi:hypothetical protein